MPFWLVKDNSFLEECEKSVGSLVAVYCADFVIVLSSSVQFHVKSFEQGFEPTVERVRRRTLKSC